MTGGYILAEVFSLFRLFFVRRVLTLKEKEQRLLYSVNWGCQDLHYTIILAKRIYNKNIIKLAVENCNNKKILSVKCLTFYCAFCFFIGR